MTRPLSDYLIVLLSSQLQRLESKTTARIPNAIRNRVDISQIVNDSLYEWIHFISTNEETESSTAIVEESHFAILIHILRMRTSDAVRKEMTWKRGGRTLIDGNDQMLQCEDLRSRESLSDLECKDTLRVITLYLDDIQQNILRLRYEGNTESEIAEKLIIPLETVRAARKEISTIAKEVLRKQLEPRTKNQEPRTKNQEKIIMENGNFPDGGPADYVYLVGDLFNHQDC